MGDPMKKTETCEFCGSDFTRRCEPKAYIGNNCYDCSFWMKKIEMSAEDEDRRVIVNGQHYMLGLDNSGPFRGFGGRTFTILFHDGRIVKTSCLWHQGSISEEFRQWLPDNATFVQATAAKEAPVKDLRIPF